MTQDEEKAAIKSAFSAEVEKLFTVCVGNAAAQGNDAAALEACRRGFMAARRIREAMLRWTDDEEKR